MSANRVHLTVTAPKCKDMQDSASKAKNVLTVINPDVFAASPRAGGYLKVMVPSRSQDYIATSDISSYSKDAASETDSEPQSTTISSYKRGKSSLKMVTPESSYYSISRDHRITEAVDESDLEMTPVEPDPELDSPETLADNMLAVTISCVMLMASNVHKISDEYFTWAERYLTCIRDEHDNHPPNIQGILNHIRYLRTKRPSKEENSFSKCTCDNTSRSRSSSPNRSDSAGSTKKKSDTKVKPKASKK